jgi:hypothetical protein
MYKDVGKRTHHTHVLQTQCVCRFNLTACGLLEVGGDPLVRRLLSRGVLHS